MASFQHADTSVDLPVVRICDRYPSQMPVLLLMLGAAGLVWHCTVRCTANAKTGIDTDNTVTPTSSNTDSTHATSSLRALAGLFCCAMASILGGQLFPKLSGPPGPQLRPIDPTAHPLVLVGMVAMGYGLQGSMQAATQLLCAALKPKAHAASHSTGADAVSSRMVSWTVLVTCCAVIGGTGMSWYEQRYSEQDMSGHRYAWSGVAEGMFGME